MTDNPPSLFPALLLALIGATALALVWATDDMPVALKYVLVVVGFVVLAFSAAILIVWFGDRIIDARTKTMLAEAQTADVLLVRELSRLTPAQAELWASRWASAIMYPGVMGPEMVFRVFGEEVPATFVKTWFKSAPDSLHAAPVRRWHDGTSERRWAEQITTYLTEIGACNPASGNRSAAWIGGTDGYYRALQAFGLEVPEQEEGGEDADLQSLQNPRPL